MNWNFDNTNHSFHNIDVPRFHPIVTGKIQTRKIHFQDLITSCIVAELKLISRQWTANQVTSYLSCKGIKMSLINKIITNSDLLYELNPVDDLKTLDPKSHKLLSENNITHFAKDHKPTILPPVWYKPYSMEKWIDAPMHLLFLGVVKKTNSIIDKWSTLFSKQKTLMKSFYPMLPCIYNMKLEWCKIIPLCPNMTFGGYVSENWSAVARLFCWMYQTIPDILSTDIIEFSDPNKPLRNWTGDEMRKWLILHGLKRTGTLAELRIRIEKAKKDHPGGLPSIIPKYKCPPDIIRNTIVSMYQMISRLMQGTCSSEMIKETNAYIHLFLNCFASWTHYLTDANKKPIWVSSYSMLNLLNLPKVMEMYGPLRNFWEGTTMGEGIIKRVKANYNRMHPNWYMTLTERTLQMRSLHQILMKIERMENQPQSNKEKDEDIDKKTASFREKSKNYHVYTDFICLQQAFDNGQPISIIIDKQMTIYAVVCNDIVYEIKTRRLLEEVYGLYYYEFSLANERSNVVLENLDIFDFGLLLPRLTGSANFEEMSMKKIYTAITTEWNQIDQNRSFNLSSFKFKGNVTDLYT